MMESSGPVHPTVPAAARRAASRWIAGMSKPTLALLVLGFITFLHVVGLGMFTHGFLLTRLTIPEVSPAYSAANPPPLPATHSKVVMIVIDALRTDFISPHHPQPPSPHHHGVLSLPAELMASRPEHSLIFSSFSDPPTTTMQRIKGITTGSLPTFIDAGANFASTSIEEDNLLFQAHAANKSVIFMGDDTWGHLFPNSFSASHPFDSFNVEDLHTVDNGVIANLFPYLEKGGWDFLIGHFLGVDHVGHRVGPDRDTMREKLQQMDDVLRKVVDKLDDDTLLVVLGDHGMNAKGDHGGDSDLEVDAALWLYSKGKPLNHGKVQSEWPMSLFPGSKEPLRRVNQIDLVPTLSLLLGLPIPFNNLGSVIPECFSDSPSAYETATRVNAEQIERYIAEYGNRDISWAVQNQRRRDASARESTEPLTRAIANRRIALAALDALRALWAQFSLSHIVIGVIVQAFAVLATIALYLGVRNGSTNWDTYVRVALDTAVTMAGGIASVVGTLAGAYTRSPAVALQTFLVAAAVVSSIVLAAPLATKSVRNVPWSLTRGLGPLVLVLHALSFASNSYIMWEDRVVVFLLVTIAIVNLLRSQLAPTSTLRLRILGFSLAFAILVRVMGASTVCREEQQPYCRVTFYEGAAGHPQWAVSFVGPVMLMALPRIVAIMFSWSRSYEGPAPFFIAVAWRVVSVVNAVYWIFEWMETWDGLNPDRIPLVKLLRTWFARASMGMTLGALPYLWSTSGLCIKVERAHDQTTSSEQVQIFGFSNGFGSTYFLWVLIWFCLVQLVSAPVAQIVLAGIITAILAHLEMVDSQRDAVLMQRSFAMSASAAGGPGAFEPSAGDALVRPSFTDVVPMALLGMLAFFATGHQAVLATIQWKAAFVGFETVTYPWSPALVVLNTWGPTLLVAIAVPLLAVWNVSPRPNGTVPVLAHALQVALAFVIYYSAITLASAVTAAWLRRHLMVWKVFAPRFMLAGVMLLVVDVAMLIAIGVGLRVTSSKVWRTFKSVSV